MLRLILDEPNVPEGVKELVKERYEAFVGRKDGLTERQAADWREISRATYAIYDNTIYRQDR